MSPGSRCTAIVTFGDTIEGTRECLDSLQANTDVACEIILVAPPLPRCTQDWIVQASRRRGWRLIRLERWLCPNAQRNRAMDLARDADFVAFVENSTIVPPGWLDRLVNHAQSSGAALTAPHYRREPPGSTSSQPRSAKPGDATFRCLLASRPALAAIAPFDEELENAWEHLDAALLLRASGGQIAICPEVTVQCQAARQQTVAEALHHAKFWDAASTRRTVARFAAKHGLAIDGVSTQRALAAAERRRISSGIARTEVQPAPLSDLADHRFAQTWAQLANQLLGLAHAAEAIVQVSRCYHLAASLHDARARACGKPFINHIVGTASILAAHGGALPLIVAGLLHAAFTQGRWGEGLASKPSLLQRRGLERIAGPAVAVLVEKYAEMKWSIENAPRTPADVEEYSSEHARLLLLRVANMIEEHLDRALCYSRKTFVFDREIIEHAQTVLPVLGFDRMLEDLHSARALTDLAGNLVPESLRTKRRNTYHPRRHPLLPTPRLPTSSLPGESAADDREAAIPAPAGG